MAGGISIPGLSDKYKTNDLVEALMNAERVPLNREKETLETYKSQQSAWREVNVKMSSLRESVKELYSFENPFNNKLASSTDENAVTASADRDAEYGSFKIDVITPAKADRFLSSSLDKNTKVPAGHYVFQVNDKSIEFNWKGGKLSDFVTSLNKRSSNTVKASLIGVSSADKSLLIESLKTGEENKLIFKDAALDFAKSIGMLKEVKSETTKFSSSIQTFKTPSTNDEEIQKGMPEISKNGISSDSSLIKLPPRSGLEMDIPAEVKNNPDQVIEFLLSSQDVTDITEEINAGKTEPDIPLSGGIFFKGITVDNNAAESTLPKLNSEEKVKLIPVSTDKIISVKEADGSESEISSSSLKTDPETGKKIVSIAMKDHPGAQSIIIRNANTGKEISFTVPQSSDSSKGLGFAPLHPVSLAEDAKVKYEGITMTRPENDIDDIVPSVTLHLHDKTEKTATITISPDKESAKDALIKFIGRYNQVLADMNILSQNKPEIIAELDYFSDSEKEEAEKKLGMFLGDSSISSGKTAMQRIISANYPYSEDAEITMLNQIGISTNASSGSRGGYNPAQMRGYLEVDEKKLDQQLETNLDEIKNIFGYDSDGDLIIDSGIAYSLDQQLSGWVQSGGILSTKTSALETRIKASNQKISNLESKLDEKEAELKAKYATMEGTLNRLESQSNTLNNFNNSGNGNK